ncbi:hypothetical protein E4U61_003755 [Claviceps capensis]|nr:hypothetical protein E4U61_003755 [Claviceps capensis]
MNSGPGWRTLSLYHRSQDQSREQRQEPRIESPTKQEADGTRATGHGLRSTEYGVGTDQGPKGERAKRGSGDSRVDDDSVTRLELLYTQIGQSGPWTTRWQVAGAGGYRTGAWSGMLSRHVDGHVNSKQQQGHKRRTLYTGCGEDANGIMDT